MEKKASYMSKQVKDKHTTTANWQHFEKALNKYDAERERERGAGGRERHTHAHRLRQRDRSQ